MLDLSGYEHYDSFTENILRIGKRPQNRFPIIGKGDRDGVGDVADAFSAQFRTKKGCTSRHSLD